MTSVFITIDTEFAFGIAARDPAAHWRGNFARSISCETPGGAVGIDYQMDVLDAHGLRAVFFVDPMPALVWGVEPVAAIVAPIAARGHDVQLHIHTEWLSLAGTANPLGGRTGNNIKDFSFEQQCILLARARDLLVEAGAPVPVAFRAGNYGSNDDTLRALAAIGMQYDTSHCPGFPFSHSDITLGPQDRSVCTHHGTIEIPAGAIAGPRGSLRHAQVTALSAGEMLAAIAHARDCGVPSFTLVSHSFELLSRDRQRINALVRRRFERLCAGIARMPGVTTATYAAEPPRPCPAPVPLLPHNPLRTAARMAEQALANALYGSR